MRRFPASLLAIATVTIMAACSSGGPGASVASMSPPVASSPASGASASASAEAGLALAGRTFLSTAVEGATLVPGSRVQLAFQPDRTLRGSAGCNSMGGTYAIADGRLKTTQLSMTEMGCEAALMRQDQWLAALLGDAAIAQAGDTITLADGTIKLTLVDKKVATPDKPIEGTTWLVDGLVTGDTTSSLPAGATASIRIADGKVAVNAGCNTGGGPVQVLPGSLVFGPLDLTRYPCPSTASAIETVVRAVLSGAVAYAIDGATLTLAAGSAGLTLRAAP